MRIDSTARSSGVSSRTGVSRTSSNGGFFVDDNAEPTQAAATSAMAPTSSLDALLALQSVEDPLFAKKKAVRRGTALLDVLDAIKADLLLGRVNEGQLNRLMMLIGQARSQSLPGLDGILDDIELRARVELAKFGRYPGV